MKQIVPSWVVAALIVTAGIVAGCQQEPQKEPPPGSGEEAIEKNE